MYRLYVWMDSQSMEGRERGIGCVCAWKDDDTYTVYGCIDV